MQYLFLHTGREREKKKKRNHQRVYEIVSEIKSNIKKKPLAFDGKSLKVFQVPWNTFKAVEQMGY